MKNKYVWQKRKEREGEMGEAEREENAESAPAILKQLTQTHSNTREIENANISASPLCFSNISGAMRLSDR